MERDDTQVREAVRGLARRRRRLGTVGLLVLGAAVVAYSLHAVDSWAERAWHAVAMGAIIVQYVWLSSASTRDDPDLVPVQITEARGSNVIVRDHCGRLLTWRVRVPVFRARPAPGAAWATTPVRRLGRTTLYATSTNGGLRRYPPAEVALAAPGGPQAAVADDERRDETVRSADPHALLAGARAAATTMRRRMLAQIGLLAAVLVSAALVVWSTRGENITPITNVFLWAGLYWFFSRGQGAAVADLRHARRLELVDAEGGLADDRLHIRAADGTRLTWAVSSVARDVPRTGPLWVTAPVQVGRRITIVRPGGRHGARVVGAVTKAVPSAPRRRVVDT